MFTQEIFRTILAAIFLTLMLFLFAKAAAATTTRTILYDAAMNEGIPPKLLVAICYAESGLDQWAHNRNDPSYGLCQLMLPTAKQMGYKGKVKGLFNAKTNAKYAAKYLKWQLKRYKNNWLYAIVAYNAGSVIRNKQGRIINFRYADRIIKILGGECGPKACSIQERD